MPSEDWRVVEYRGRAALERLEADWRRLYASMPLPQQRPPLRGHLAYLRASHEVARGASGASRSATAGEVRAICPLEARAETALGIPVPAWAIPRHLLTPVADAVYADDEAAPCSGTGGRSATCASTRRAAACSCSAPSPRTPCSWEGVRRLDPRAAARRSPTGCDVFDCAQPFDELMSRLGKHFRRNLRSHRKKLNRLDDVRFVTAADDATLGPAFETFLDIEASGWKGAKGTRTAIRFKPNQPAFFRALATTFDGDDRCEINALHVDGRCIASEFCIRTGAEYARIKIGYDEEYAALGPGQLILQTTLERLCQDPGVKCFNMMSGAGWLDDWHPDKLVLQQTHVALGALVRRPADGASALPLRPGAGDRPPDAAAGTSSGAPDAETSPRDPRDARSRTDRRGRRRRDRATRRRHDRRRTRALEHRRVPRTRRRWSVSRPTGGASTQRCRERTAFHAFEAHAAYFAHLATAPDRCQVSWR